MSHKEPNARNAYWRAYAQRPHVKAKRQAYMAVYYADPVRRMRRKLRWLKYPPEEVERRMQEFMELPR